MEPIAIIGMGCRFPGASNPEAYWQLLRDGVDAITEVPRNRWDVDAFYDPEPGTPGKMSTRWGGFLEQVDQFDPGFFGISPREVERMDPQQRLVLEVAWEAIEHAGLAADRLSGSQTGVFMGIGNYDYCRLLAGDLTLVSAYDGTGNTLSIAANRLSYILNLRGPSVVVETACSSSLVALHFACRSLQTKESDMCLVGGVSLMLSPEPFITYSHARMMASDGRCKTFDARADGYVRGEGCGVVLLKRLADAVKDKDNVLAIIRGTAINQDGLSNGLTAPNGPSQQAVIRRALQNAGVSPAQISYIEAHGTGTSLGDPIEFKSLKAILMQERRADQPCWLGSVKTNIGHLEAASGIASVIKVVLALQHREIPPHLHLKQLNPYISLEGTTFVIPNDLQPWFVGTEGRFAGISAFGFGGTNCHTILEEAKAEFRLPILGLESTTEQKPQEKEAKGESHQTNPIEQTASMDRRTHLLSLSAKNEQALKELAQRYVDFLATHPEATLADVCFTANTGRSHFEHRLAVVANSHSQLREQLQAFAAGENPTGWVSGQANHKTRPKLAMLFTGQGSQYKDMGRQLYETQPVFRQAIDRCNELLRPHLQQSLLSVLYSDHQPPTSEIQAATLDDTAYTQPALFALEYALFQLWTSWGIEPAVVMGHSVGEYVAACVAGVFSLEDGLKLIAARARLMQALPSDGAMVAVFATQAQVEVAIQPHEREVAIAAMNGPQSIVISGKRDVVETVIAELQTQGIKTKQLNVSHAFHSPLMEPMLAEFETIAATINFSSPRIKLISNVTGALATDEIATPAYWCRHVRQPVQFAASMETLNNQGYKVFLEVGPKPTLLGMGRHCLPDGAAAWLSSLYPGREDWQSLLQSLATLYIQGASIDWSSFDQPYPRHRLQLPTYPFQRQRYWVEFSDQAHSNGKNGSQLTDQMPLLNLLQGDTQALTQQLQAVGDLSEDELKLLPKLLDALAKHQNKQRSLTAIQHALQHWLYQVEWQPQPRLGAAIGEKNGFQKSGSWLIFTDTKGIGNSLANLLQAQGHHCFLVQPGDTYQFDSATTWSINPTRSTHVERLIQDVLNMSDRPLKGVIHLWSLDTAEPLTIPSLEQAQQLGVGSVLHVLQALTKYNPSDSARLWLVTQNAVAIEPSDLAVAQAPLWGLGRVIALEHPELWGGMVDLASDATQDDALPLMAEITHSHGEDHLAFRDGKRYVARIVQTQLPNPAQPKLHSEGTYLITGGLGALGLKIAQWMADNGVRYLVLTGRRGMTPEAQTTLSQLEQAGVNVLVAQADVSDEEDVITVLRTIEQSMPPLRGIIHAAGVLKDGILLQQDWEQFTQVMAPKVQGAWHLHKLTQTLPLDFFVLFSSAASMLGSPGQGNYAAANAFMDTLACYRRSLGLPGLSINWGPWGDAGMAANLSDRHQGRLAAQGLSTIATEQGLSILGYLLSQPLAQVGVLPFEWSVFKQQLSSGRQLPLLAELIGEPDVQAAVKPAPQQELLQHLKQAPANQRQGLLTTYLQSKAARVLGLTTTELEADRSLHEVGLDSLMAVELTSLIRDELQVELPIRALIEDPSIAKIAALILEQLMPGHSSINGSKATIVMSKDVDLDAEAVLDQSISPDHASVEPVIEPESILLTGATGFMGAFLLHDLLDQTHADIYCLVRSADLGSAVMRLHQNLKSYNLWDEQFTSRIIPVLGDLGEPQLGLTDEQHQRLAHQIDTIYHNGALLNYVYPYSKFKPINVLGTQEILKLACTTKVKPVHHVSSVAVFESSAYYGKPVTELDDIDRSEGIYLGYSQSKWVSERLVIAARDRGLPVTIHRPPLVSGHSRTGVWNTDGFLCRMIKGCVQMGSIMADLDLVLDLSPVDYNSEAIVYLSRQSNSVGKVFHLQNPHLLHWSELVDFICSMGYPMEKVSFKEWQVRLSQSRENPLYPLLPFFQHKWGDTGLTYIELNEQGRRPIIGYEETLKALAGTPIVCPMLDARLLNIYFSYFIRSGFLETPKRQVMSLKAT